MAETKKIGDDTAMLTRLWLHECTRIFRDRLTDEPDRLWFDNNLKTMVLEHFKKKWEQLVSTDRLIWGDYMVAGADPRLYVEVDDQVCLYVRVRVYVCVCLCLRTGSFGVIIWWLGPTRVCILKL
jgi:dynein heavy chain